MKTGLKLIGASTLTFALSATIALGQSAQDPELRLFVGPQAVIPGQPIFLTAEVTSDKTESVELVTLITGEGADHVRFEKRTKNGIANFVVSAPSQTGRVTFLAITPTMISYEAEILVVSDQPQEFDVFVHRHNTNQIVATATSTIQDQFQNVIEDGVMADIHWLKNGHLMLSEQTIVRDGKISNLTRCEEIQTASHVSVRIRNQQATVPVSLTWCRNN